MERLTTKIDNKYFYDVDDIKIGQKLGELEDVLEKYNIDDLDKFIGDLIDRAEEYENIVEKMLRNIAINSNYTAPKINHRVAQRVLEEEIKTRLKDCKAYNLKNNSEDRNENDKI